MTESSSNEPTLSKKSEPATDEPTDEPTDAVTALRLGAQLLRELTLTPPDEDEPETDDESPKS